MRKKEKSAQKLPSCIVQVSKSAAEKQVGVNLHNFINMSSFCHEQWVS